MTYYLMELKTLLIRDVWDLNMPWISEAMNYIYQSLIALRMFGGLISKNILSDNLFYILNILLRKTYNMGLIEEGHFNFLLLHILNCDKISHPFLCQLH